MEEPIVMRSDSDDETGLTSIKDELADVPLGELQAIREKIGAKKFDLAMRKTRQERQVQSFKRANKNRPKELSSKKPVSRFQEVVHVPKSEEAVKDPRFSDNAGHLNLDLFKKSYSFVDDIKKREKETITKQFKKTRDPGKKGELKMLLQKIESRELTEQRVREGEDLLREHRRAEREMATKGKKPFYMKKSTQKKLLLVRKYSELKKSGKLEKFLTKKRKKNAQRDRKQLPFSRNR